MDFYRDISCPRDAFTYGYVIYKSIHDIPCKMIQICVLLNKLSTIVPDFDFFFNFAIWNMEDYFTVAKVIILPSIIYTIMSSPIIYLIVKLILTKFAIKEKIEIKKDAGE